MLQNSLHTYPSFPSLPSLPLPAAPTDQLMFWGWTYALKSESASKFTAHISFFFFLLCLLSHSRQHPQINWCSEAEIHAEIVKAHNFNCLPVCLYLSPWSSDNWGFYIWLLTLLTWSTWFTPRWWKLTISIDCLFVCIYPDIHQMIGERGIFWTQFQIRKFSKPQHCVLWLKPTGVVKARIFIWMLA